MRFLDRAQHPAPQCLARYHPGQDWMVLSRDPRHYRMQRSQR